jgi:hypothetical protein
MTEDNCKKGPNSLQIRQIPQFGNYGDKKQDKGCWPGFHPGIVEVERQTKGENYPVTLGQLEETIPAILKKNSRIPRTKGIVVSLS